MPRFVAALYDPDDPNAARRAAAGAAALRNADARWREALSEKGATLLALDRGDGFRTHVLPDGAGAVFGAVFRRQSGRSAAVRAFDPQESSHIQSTEGVSLLTSVWGGYVALVRGKAPGRWSVLRDPSGVIAVYHVRHAGVHLLFSHIEDALAFDPPLDVDWRVLASTALFIHYPGRDTAIEGVTRISPGDRLPLDAAGAADAPVVAWRASDAVSARRIDDPDQAAEELYAAVLDSVRSWSSLFDTIMLTLSGGLDSSIVAGALRETNTTAAVTCINLYFDARSPRFAQGALRGDLAYLGDERTYARSMAERCGYPLVERARSIALMDFDQLETAPLTAYPSPLVYGLDTNKIFGGVAEEVGAQAMLGGDGGDLVFFSTPEILPALDAVAHHGLSRRSLAAILDAARLSRESVWHVLAAVVRHQLTGRSSFKTEPEEVARSMLVDPDRVPPAEDRIRGSWSAPEGMPPGKNRHAWAMQADIGSWREFPLSRRVEPIEPLLAQPVVETALQIPTYILSRHGVSRGLARQAFKGVLSPAVYNRRSKGTGVNLYPEIVLTKLAFIREALLDGALVRHGVLDRKKLETALGSETHLRQEKTTYLFNFLAAEFWLRGVERERRQARRVA